MRDELDAVGWASLKHNYGSAADVPGLLRRCAGPDPEDADTAGDELRNLLFHQGGWICPAAPAALPFLLRLAADPRAPGRLDALALVATLAAEAEQVEERFLDPGWRPAWERALPGVLALLDDPEPAVRRTVVQVIRTDTSPGAPALPVLLRRREVEQDPAVRLDLLLCLGAAVRREPAGPHAGAVSALLHALLDDPDPQLRLAAVHALAPGDPELAARHLDSLVNAVRDPGVEVWRHSASLGSGTRGVQRFTAALLGGAPATSFTLGLLAGHPDEEQRSGAVAEAAALLARWRPPTARLLPAVAARLDDPATEVRFLAAELLACLGPAAAAHADGLAALLEDAEARENRLKQTVAEAAVWALARMNDPRCLPALTGLLAAERTGFATNTSFYPDTDWHYAVLPALHEVVAYLPDHAGALLPAVSRKIATATDPHVLTRYCEVLRDWGPLAAPAVPQLLGMLEEERTWTAAATALAGIGTAGNGARELLLARAEAGGDDARLAAWAHWKVGGGPGPLLAALGHPAADWRGHGPELALIADVGPHAGAFTGRLRYLAGAAGRDEWTAVRAAQALWAVTGEAEGALPALLAAVRGLEEGTYRPVMLAAVRTLASMGPAARPAAELLRRVPELDRRLHSGGTWRGFTDDEAIRGAVGALLAATG